MKLITFILISSMLQVSAVTFGQKLTFKQNEVTLTKLFYEIRKQTGYDVLIKGTAIAENKRIDVNFSDAPLTKVIDLVLSGTDLVYSIDNKVIIIKPKDLSTGISSKLADIDVRGRVLDKNRKPLLGVNVTIKGTTRGASTDDRGLFQLSNVNEGAILVISSIGYAIREISAKPHLGDILLEESVAQLEDVEVTVNTGYQRIAKERNTGSFSKPDMKVVSDRTTSMNILNRLEGLVPGLAINPNLSQGLAINQSDNDIRRNKNSILMRGVTSLDLARNPLYIVDGVQIADISSINPQDIEDVTVLKDATANSIWGSRAANGVIVIATKRGKESSKLDINYNSFFHFLGKPELDYSPVLTSEQYIQAAREVFNPTTFTLNSVSANSNGKGIPPHELIQYQLLNTSLTADQRAALNAQLDALAIVDNRNQIKDLFYRDASLINHTVSLRGGGKVHTFYGSVAFTNSANNTPGAENRNYKLMLNQDFNINKRLRFYLNADLTYGNASRPNNISANYSYIPYQLFRDVQGNNITMNYMGNYTDANKIVQEQRGRINMDYTPLDEIDMGFNKANSFNNRLVGGISLNILKGLKVEGTYGYTKGSIKDEAYRDNRTYTQREEILRFTVNWQDPAVSPKYILPINGGRYDLNNSRNDQWTIRHQATYDRLLGNKHQVSALFGQEAQEQKNTNNANVLRGYDINLLSFASIDYAALSRDGVTGTVSTFGGTSKLADESYREINFIDRFTSYYANVSYTYDLKYSLNGSWRIDKSNLFGLDKSAQNKPVWSAGAKWTISKENFMKEIAAINNLALRVTHGIAGNAPSSGTAASRPILSLVDQGNQSLVPYGRGLYISVAANPKLTWERTVTTNLGLDFEFLERRLSGSLDVYDKQTTGLLGNLEVNPLTGFTTITGNVGDLSNRGIELSLTSVNIVSRGFVWNTTLTGAYNKMKISNLGFLTIPNTAADRITREYLPDYSVNSVFAYRYAGLNSSGNPQVYKSDGTITSASNSLVAEDVEYMGVSLPKWTGGFSNIFSYKGFRLNVNMIYNLGHVMRRDVNTFFSGRLTTNAQSFTSGNVHADFAKRWKNAGDEEWTDIPKYIAAAAANTARFPGLYTSADKHVFDASYIKIRDVALAYSLPKSLLHNIKVNNATIRFQVSNLMVWKANKHDIDPEFHSNFNGNGNYSSTGVRGVRNNQGTFAIGLNVGF